VIVGPKNEGRVAFCSIRLHDDNAVALGLKAGSGKRDDMQLPGYFHRLSPHAQRVFLKSNEIAGFDFVPSHRAIELASNLIAALETGALSSVSRAAQTLLDELCRVAGLPAIVLQVRNVRPHNVRGELHGIFYPRGNGRGGANPYEFSTATSNGPLIILWMRTAQRHDVVKPRTFLRTLMHEFAHYLDYALLRLGDSPHTPGFFKRESFLVRMFKPGQEGD
jgi:hypothetical protein